MTTVSTDVLVVGAGLAGLHAATLLARRGHDILLVERRANLAGRIRTTGIFVRRTLDDFPFPSEHLGPAIRRVALYPPQLQRSVCLVSGRDEYRVADMAPLYMAVAANASESGVRVALGTRYAGRQGRTSLLIGPDGRTTEARARFVVGANGARSRVAGYADRFTRGLRGALERFGAVAPGLGQMERPEVVERSGGPIPVGGVLRRIGCADGLLVGDAAGAVSPLTAGGLDPCLRLSELAAEVLDDALRSDRSDTLARYDGSALSARFRGRLLLRHGLAQVRTPGMASAAFGLLRTPLGRAAARRILFGDRSFPGPDRR